MTLEDLPDLLASAPPERPAATIFGFDLDEAMEQQNPGWKAQRAREKVEKARKEDKFRAAVLQKYGSRDAALADDDLQRTVEAAGAHLLQTAPYQYANGVSDRTTLGGWTRHDRNMPKQVEEVIRSSPPFPATVSEAKLELDYWTERDRELGAMYGDDIGDSYLSLACAAREHLVQKAFETGIRARSVAEVEMRHRYSLEADFNCPEIDQAVLEDLQHLIAQQDRAPVQTGHQTATERRAEIMRLLSNEDTKDLPDREIARRVGGKPAHRRKYPPADELREANHE